VNPSPDFVTVYRSSDATAQEDCETIAGLLTGHGLSSKIVHDAALGAYAIQVSQADAAAAERLIDDNRAAGEGEQVDDSPNLDLQTIFAAVGISAEMQALSIKNVLEANGITAVMGGNSVLPYLPFEVKVAREQVDRARDLIAEAQIAGPASADEAELETETAEPQGPRKPETA
jgi:hypothetical protein